MQDKTEGMPEARNKDLSGKLGKSNIKAAHHGTTMRFSQQTVEKRITGIFSNIQCTVRFAGETSAKISEMDDAYFEILRHWDKRALYYDKGFRILVMSGNDELSFEIILNSRSKPVKREEFLETFKNIQDIQPSCKVFLGQNNPKKPVVPTDKETSLARYIKKIGEQLRVKIVDQLIVSGTECFSFEENEYMQGVTVMSVNK